MAVAIATTMVKPDYRFFPMINGGLPLWVVTLVFLIVDMASVPSGDPGKYLAHLAGGAAGFCSSTSFAKATTEYMDEQLLRLDKRPV